MKKVTNDNKRFDMIAHEDGKFKVYDKISKLIYSFDENNYMIFSHVIRGEDTSNLCEQLNISEQKVENAIKDIDKILNCKKARCKLGLIYPKNTKSFKPIWNILYFMIVYLSIPFFITSVILNINNIKDVVSDAMNNTNIGFWGGMLMVLIISTVFHEMGHMIVARHFGCITLEFGVKLSGFIPCGYTSIYGATYLKSRVKKILILSGGILVNLLFAGISCWLIDLENTFVSKVGTEFGLLNLGLVFINSLIFFEFDGYYILEEFVGKGFKKEAINYTKKLFKTPSMKIWNSKKGFFVVYTLLSFLLIPLFIISMIPSTVF